MGDPEETGKTTSIIYASHIICYMAIFVCYRYDEYT